MRRRKRASTSGMLIVVDECPSSASTMSMAVVASGVDMCPSRWRLGGGCGLWRGLSRCGWTYTSLIEVGQQRTVVSLGRTQCRDLKRFIYRMMSGPRYGTYAAVGRSHLAIMSFRQVAAGLLMSAARGGPAMRELIGRLKNRELFGRL